MAPPTDCLRAHRREGAARGPAQGGARRSSTPRRTRPPAVYRGNPFQIEVGLAYGGELAGRRAGPRHPLRQSRAAALPAVGVRLLQGGGRDELEELRTAASREAACPPAPLVIMIHMASVWVPFTSEIKEAIADYDEIRKEMKLALQECGRKLGTYLRRRQRMRREADRRSAFERYIGEIAQSCQAAHGNRGGSDLRGPVDPGPAPHRRGRSGARR